MTYGITYGISACAHVSRISLRANRACTEREREDSSCGSALILRRVLSSDYHRAAAVCRDWKVLPISREKEEALIFARVAYYILTTNPASFFLIFSPWLKSHSRSAAANNRELDYWWMYGCGARATCTYIYISRLRNSLVFWSELVDPWWIVIGENWERVIKSFEWERLIVSGWFFFYVRVKVSSWALRLITRGVGKKIVQRILIDK